jgi:hypothetical protein
MKPQYTYIKPFLVLLNIMPERLMNIKNEKNIDTNLILMDDNIVKVLRAVTNV